MMTVIVERPKSCQMDSTCICLCRDVDGKECKKDYCRTTDISILPTTCFPIGYDKDFSNLQGADIRFKNPLCTLPGFGIDRTDDHQNACVSDTKKERRVILHSERVGDAVKFCSTLINSHCLTQEELRAKEMTEKLHAEISRKMNDCMARGGASSDACTCALADISFLPADTKLSISDTIDTIGSTKHVTRYFAYDPKTGYPLTQEPFKADPPFCLFDLDANAQLGTEAKLSVPIPPEYAISSGSGERLLFLKYDGKVCLAIHDTSDPTSIFQMDTDDGSVTRQDVAGPFQNPPIGQQRPRTTYYACPSV